MAVEPDTRPLAGEVFLVTGGRRGIGEQITLGLAELGANVAVSYVSNDKNKLKKTETLEGKLDKLGVQSRFVRADISTAEGRRTLIEAGRELGNTVPGEFRGFRGICLNAAAGLEATGGEYYAHEVNFLGNRAFVEETTPMMARGSDYELIQSLWGHQDRPAPFNDFQRARLLPFYGLIARTKFDSEAWLREQIPALRQQEINVNVLVGHVIEGTGAFSMLKRYFKDRLDVLRDTVQGEEFKTPEGMRFPNAVDMGRAAVNMFLAPPEQKANGQTVYVGGNRAEPADPKIFLPYELDRRGVSDRLPMYDETTLLVDSFVSGDDKMRGTTRFTVRESDVAGHFTGPFADLKLLRAVLIAEIAAQSMGLVFKGLEPQEGIPVEKQMVGYYDTLPEMKVDKMVLPGDTITTDVEITAMSGRNFKGRAEMKVGDELVAAPKGIVLGLAPYEMILDMYNKTKTRREALRAVS